MKDFLRKLNVLTEEEIGEFCSLSEECSLDKGDFLIREGNISDSVGFVKSGILRSFYNTVNGDELTYCISFHNSFITAYSSFITGNPSVENIQAITPVQLYLISKENILKLTQNGANWLRFSKMMAEHEYLLLEKRVFSYQKESARDRYLNMLKDHPAYIQHIPLKYLASYLGVTPRHLSRLRAELIK